ncbi:hypothetical protein FIBSPDRAFT_879919 [Athelia psychrophila]|uniref:Uncharacterized protein n=1 Tax=Athelia psychrophila TaxID=1759441 RepID=A0A167TGM1_9AGAM|nr:hypothetical protein FIBSPDRAFT_879919 [Fibularhizoctonia sp. CBS 109695]
MSAHRCWQQTHRRQDRQRVRERRVTLQTLSSCSQSPVMNPGLSGPRLSHQHSQHPGQPPNMPPQQQQQPMPVPTKRASITYIYIGDTCILP